MAVSAIYNFVAGQNGNTEITVLPEGPVSLPPEAFVPPAPEQLVLPELCAPSPARQSIPDRTIEPPRGPTQSLKALVETFKAQSRHLASSTRQTLESHWKVAARHLDFEQDVRDIRLGDLRKLKSRLSEDHKPSSVNDIIYKGLGALFRIAVEDEIIDRSPLERLKRSRNGEPDRQQPNWEQSQRIVEAIPDSFPETKVIVGFMRNFGVGQAEIKSLLGEHIETQAGVIHFRRKKTGKAFDVPIFPHARAFIDALKSDGRLELGKPVVKWRNPRKALATACEHVSLPVYEPRALRRCFIVHCLQQGIDPRLVAKWQGHRDAKLIFSVYGKFIDRNYEQIQAQKLGEQPVSS
jgi:integrase